MFFVGPCHVYISEPNSEASSLNLAAVKPTNVQVSNCCFLGSNKLRHRLLHYPALTDVPIYSRT
jgi:hypothetical protein